jgi:hypothetical protein
VRPFLYALPLVVGCAAPAAEPLTEEEDLGARPAELFHTDADTPVPTWDAAIRVWDGPAAAETTIRILGGDPAAARARFEAWEPTVRRGFVLLLDKLINEGWASSIDRIDNIWDSAFHIWPRTTSAGTLDDILEAKAAAGHYVENSLDNGLVAYFNKWNHRDWVRAWAETDARNATLHVGRFADGRYEVHLELYNPVFVVGAPRWEVISGPLLGAFNWRTLPMHQKWENGAEAANRRSANHYHFMKNGAVPLSF